VCSELEGEKRVTSPSTTMSPTYISCLRLLFGSLRGGEGRILVGDKYRGKLKYLSHFFMSIFL